MISVESDPQTCNRSPMGDAYNTSIIVDACSDTSNSSSMAVATIVWLTVIRHRNLVTYKIAAQRWICVCCKILVSVFDLVIDDSNGHASASVVIPYAGDIQ